MILSSYTWNKNAADTFEQTPSRIIKECLKNIEILINSTDKKAHKLYEGYTLKVWINGFSIFTPCQYTNFFPEMIQPHFKDRLFFAGEHISWSHGWIQGALESGIVAAHRVLCQISYSHSCDNIPFTSIKRSKTCQSIEIGKKVY